MSAPVDIEKLLAALKIEGKRRGTKWHARCPNPDHDDSHPSWFIRDDPGAKWHGSHNCRSCGLSGGTWELVATVRGITVEDAGKWVWAFSGGREEKPRDVNLPRVQVRTRRLGGYQMPPGCVFPTVDPEARWFNPALDYLLARQITMEQIERWCIGYATKGPLAWRVVIPIFTRERLAAYVARAFINDGSPRYDMPTRASGARPDLALFGEPLFDRTQGIVTVAEGVFSALALERAGAPNVCALLGSELTTGKITPLHGFERIIVATDPDAAGAKAFEKLQKMLGRHAELVRMQLELSPDDSAEEDLRARLAPLVTAPSQTHG